MAGSAKHLWRIGRSSLLPQLGSDWVTRAIASTSLIFVRRSGVISNEIISLLPAHLATRQEEQAGSPHATSQCKQVELFETDPVPGSSLNGAQALSGVRAGHKHEPRLSISASAPSRRLPHHSVPPVFSADACAAGIGSLTSQRQRGLATKAEAATVEPLHEAVGEYNISVDIAVPFKCHKVDPPPSQTSTSAEEILRMFRSMALMRRMEITADLLYKQGKIRGFCHLYDGQEAIAVGMEAALTYDDSIITAYRDHCTFLGRGGTVKQVFSELLGRVDGASRGKGGSMHLYYPDHNYYGGQGIVGTPAPLGTGIAYGIKLRKEAAVCCTMFGDGAANQGQVYEAYNMAALYDLPVIYVVENNHFGMGTAEWRASKDTTFFSRTNYMPGIKADGMDVFSVKVAMEKAKDHCLAGKGPLILELDTYRYHGHSMSDPGSTYRTRDEIQGIRRARDPIDYIRKLIIKENVRSPEELKAIEKEVKREVDASVEESLASPEPTPDELFTHIYNFDRSQVVFRTHRPTSQRTLP